MPSKKTSGNKNPNEFYRYTGMAMKMAIVILIGVLGGRKLDELYSPEAPWFTIFLSLFSVGIAIYIVITDTRN